MNTLRERISTWLGTDRLEDGRVATAPRPWCGGLHAGAWAVVCRGGGVANGAEPPRNGRLFTVTVAAWVWAAPLPGMKPWLWQTPRCGRVLEPLGLLLGSASSRPRGEVFPRQPPAWYLSYGGSSTGLGYSRDCSAVAFCLLWFNPVFVSDRARLFYGAHRPAGFHAGHLFGGSLVALSPLTLTLSAVLGCPLRTSVRP
jgi:hypothetical protein